LARSPFGGKCSYIRIEKKDYNKWEQTYCPRIAEGIEVIITLTTEITPDSPPVKPLKIIPTLEQET